MAQGGRGCRTKIAIFIPRQKTVAVRRPFGNHLAMLARVCSAAVNGIDAYAVEVEVNCGFGETFIAFVVIITPE